MGRWYRAGAAALLGIAAAVAVTLGPAGPLAAQAVNPPDPPAAAPGPYAGQQEGVVRGLSDAEIAGYREARGMGLARPADINGFPGPLHVLELHEALGLSAEQRDAVQALYDRMRGEASALGEEFLARYAELEAAFRSGTITPETLAERTAEIGRIEGALRETHLRYHLLTRAILRPEQIAAYAQLRGYATEHQPGMTHQPGITHQPGMTHRP